MGIGTTFSRVNGRLISQLLGVVVLALLFVSSRCGSPKITAGGASLVERSALFRVCGQLGQHCCHAPNNLQSPGVGPLVACDKELGCDITTDLCVSPCGGVGQACCDGPETRSPKWTLDGKVYSPNYWNMREMCDSGACAPTTHRCFACGTSDGAACC